MKRTELEIMLKVAELGLLKENKKELTKMAYFMKGLNYGKTGVWKITENKILYASWEEDHFSPVYDITYYVLLVLYGNKEEQNEEAEAGFEFSIEDSCYVIDKSFEVDSFEIINKEVR